MSKKAFVKKWFIISTLMFGCGLMMVPAETYAEPPSVGGARRSIEYDGVVPGEWDPEYLKVQNDIELKKRYFWKTDCDLLLGVWDESTWRCSFSNQVSFPDIGNTSDEQWAAYANKLYQKGLKEGWNEPARFKDKLWGELTLGQIDSGWTFDPFTTGAPMSDRTWSLEEMACGSVAVSTGTNFVYNRRTKGCYDPSDPCVKVHICWGDACPSKEDIAKEENKCHAQNGGVGAAPEHNSSMSAKSMIYDTKSDTFYGVDSGENNGGLGGGNGNNNGNQNGSSGQKTTRNTCVSTTFMGEVCDNKGDGAPIMDIINNVITIMSFGVGVVGVAGITIAGIQYLTAAGNEEKAKKARRRMAEVVIGVASFVLLWAVLNWLTTGGV